jgi:hypothetical protein
MSRGKSLFLTFGEYCPPAVKNRELDEIRKKVGRRREERRDIPRASYLVRSCVG